MKKIILILSLVLSLNIASYAYDYYNYNSYNNEIATKTIVNDSTIIFYNVDKIAIKQSGSWTTCIIDVDTNKLIAKFEGSKTIDLEHKGNYMVMSRKKFTKTDVITNYERVCY